MIAVIARLILFFETNNLLVLTMSIYAGLTVGLFSYAMYKLGSWGGGDVKMIIGTSILIAWLPGELIPSFISYLSNILIIGALYTLPITIIIGLKNKCKASKKDKILMIIGAVSAAIILTLTGTMIGLLIATTIFLTCSINYLKRVESKCMVKPANMKTLMDGDWLVNEIKVGQKIITPKKEGLTKAEAEQIKDWWAKGKLKEKPLIKEGLPFVPALLLALIPTILGVNLIIMLIQ
jgi:hypothetical protein